MSGGPARVEEEPPARAPGPSDGASAEHALFRAVREGVDDHAVFALDRDGVILTWNAGGKRLTHFEPREVVGRHFRVLYPPEEVALGTPLYDLAAASDAVHHRTQGWRVRKGGSRYWADVAIGALKDDDGRTAGYAVVISDLTHHRNETHALAEEAERHRLLVREVRDYGIHALDQQGRIRSWNEGARRISGYERDEVLGKHFAMLFTTESARAGRPRRILEQAELRGQYSEDAWRVRRDGTRFWAGTLITSLRDARGNLVGYSTVLRDLTDRRRTEEALAQRERQQGAVAELGMHALGGRRLATLMDEAVRALASALEVEYAKVLRLLPDGKALRLEAGVGWREGIVGRATVPAERDSQAGYTLFVNEPVVVEDLRREVRFQGPPLLTEHGVVSGLSVIIPGEGDEPWGVLGAHTTERRAFTVDDIHFMQNVANVLASTILRHRTEQDLEWRVEERTRELVQANRELEAFNGMVAHDLRAPVRAIAHLSRVAKTDYAPYLGPEGADLMDALGRSSERVASLVEALLTFSRATTADVEPEDIDLSAIAEEAVADARTGVHDARDVEVVIEPGLRARGDQRLVRALLSNLFENALKFSRPMAGPHVEFGAEDRDGTRWFFVRDNGIGFPPERAHRLFGAFERLHPDDAFEGTGIGLATVRRIVERHGGAIHGESDGPGHGATFSFTLGGRSGD